MSATLTPVLSYATEGWERRNEFDSEVELPLNLEELLERSQQLVDALANLDDIGSELSRLRQEYKKRRDDLGEVTARLRAEIKDRRRKAKRRVVQWMHWGSNVVHLVDVETGRVVEERAITGEERQLAMGPPPKADAPAAGEAPLAEGDVDPVIDVSGPAEGRPSLDDIIDDALDDAGEEEENVIRLPSRGGDEDDDDDASAKPARRGPRGGLPPEPGEPKRRGPQRRRV